MTIEAFIVRDSQFDGHRLTTLVIRYPRFIHSEFMTHRLFSRNASSSRAIPIKRLLSQILHDPAVSVHWGRNQAGMQAHAELTEWRLFCAKVIWHFTGFVAVTMAYLMYLIGVHKQVGNRMIEPWSHITVIVTATEWKNFFDLRDHEDAEPNIQALAKAIRDAMNRSAPMALEEDQWHLPFVGAGEMGLPILTQIKLSVARCARVSYLNHDGSQPDQERDLELYDRLVGSKPWHASPLEHQGRPLTRNDSEDLQGNFEGMVQYRKMFEMGIKP